MTVVFVRVTDQQAGDSRRGRMLLRDALVLSPLFYVRKKHMTAKLLEAK